jgi:site-specific recombinase XerC
MKAKTARGIPLAVSAWTLERYLHYWLREIAAYGLRVTTVAGYETVVRVHLVPPLEKKQLTRLTPHDVRRLVTDKRQSGLSVRMFQYIHAVLRNALQNAVREELVSRNVAKLVQVESPRIAIPHRAVATIS